MYRKQGIFDIQKATGHQDAITGVIKKGIPSRGKHLGGKLE